MASSVENSSLALGSNGSDSFTGDDGFCVELGFASHAGTTRADNQDRVGYAISDDGAVIIVVADGVSGEIGGEVASEKAVEVTLRTFCREPPNVNLSTRLKRATQQANIAVYDLAVVVPELQGMSTTLTAAAVRGATLTAVHVGDTRLYLQRRGELLLLSKDHNLAAERSRFARPSQEEAARDKTTLTRSLGRDLIAQFDRIDREIDAGDRLLVCSDGLYNVLAHGELAALLVESGARHTARSLIEAANARGTPDNLSAAVLSIVQVPDADPKERRLRSLFSKLFS